MNFLLSFRRYNVLTTWLTFQIHTFNNCNEIFFCNNLEIFVYAFHFNKTCKNANAQIVKKNDFFVSILITFENMFDIYNQKINQKTFRANSMSNEFTKCEKFENSYEIDDENDASFDEDVWNFKID